MADTDLRQEIIDVLDELGAAVDEDIEQVTEIDEHVSIPGVRVDSQGNFVSYCLAKLNVFQNYFAQIWNAWFGTSTSTGVQGEWASLKSDAQADHTQAGQDHTQAQSDHTRAESDHTTASGDHTRAETDHNTATSDHQQATSDTGRASTDHSTATSDHTQAGNDHSIATGDHTTAQGDHTQAGNDHTRAESDHSTATQDHTQAGTDHTRAESDHTKVAGAENLNATLVGFTVSITNRQGVTTSVDIGFEIYRTYASITAMNADAANVPQGKFVVIATTDPTDPDNAKMYCRNSQPATATTPFQFLCDLDQASSSAWADWLNNQKPLIIQATADANDAAALANTKAQLADDKATLANTKAQYAEEQGDRAKAYNDHPWEIGNDGYIYVWDETTEQMVRTNKLIISFDDLTDAQIQAMIDLFFQTLVFDDTPTQGSDNVVKSGGIWTALQLKMDKSNVATVQTCEDIIDELI